MHYTLTVSRGIAMLSDPDEGIRSNAIAIGYGVTNDQAVADLIRTITFDGKE